MSRARHLSKRRGPWRCYRRVGLKPVFRKQRTKLMDEVTQHHGPRHLAARHSDDVTPVAPPRLIEEAARIFLALGITATDLRLRAKPGSPLGVLADAMETPTGIR
jgi:hypothetical protein